MKHQEKVDNSVVLSERIYDYLNSIGIVINQPRIQYEVLAMQIIESMGRVEYFQILANRDISPNRLDPLNDIFDPVRAILDLRGRDYDEACWLTFLLVYTAENYQSDWNFLRQLYLGVDETLTWEVAKNNVHIFSRLSDQLITSQSKPKFGNHAKYKSLKHIPMVFESYINLINTYNGHTNFFRKNTFVDKKQYFEWLFTVVETNIYSFGRLTTFDYLSMLSKTGLANIEPNSCHIVGSTGPKDGAQLLFGVYPDLQLDNYAMGLADHIGIGYQEMEDALCNWQKSPQIFYSYSG